MKNTFWGVIITLLIGYFVIFIPVNAEASLPTYPELTQYYSTDFVLQHPEIFANHEAPTAS